MDNSLASSSAVSFVGQNLKLCSGVALWPSFRQFAEGWADFIRLVISQPSTILEAQDLQVRTEGRDPGSAATSHRNTFVHFSMGTCRVSLPFLASIERKNFLPNASGRTMRDKFFHLWNHFQGTNEVLIVALGVEVQDPWSQIFPTGT